MWFCGTCGKQFVEETDDIDFWVGCDFCSEWFCCVCEQLLEPPPKSELYEGSTCCTKE